MLGMFCFGSSMIGIAQTSPEIATRRRPRARVGIQRNQHFFGRDSGKSWNISNLIIQPLG
jgi:hypothetical protein